MPSDTLPFETVREEIPSTDGVPEHTSIAQSPSALAEAFAAPRRGRPEAIATLYELLPYVSRAMGGITYYMILSKRLKAKGDPESIEIKAARQLQHVPKEKRRDAQGNLVPGLLDLVALGLTPEEVQCIRNQPTEYDASMKLHKAGIPNGEGQGDNALSPEAVTARWERSDGGQTFGEQLGRKLSHAVAEGRPDAKAARGNTWLERAGRRELCAADGQGSTLWDRLESLPRTLSGRG